MRKMMILGGAIGFDIGVLSGLVTEGSTWPTILLRSSIGALVAGLLMRWWAGIWSSCWQQVNNERMKARENNQPSTETALSK
jgi:hypothetical protein